MDITPGPDTAFTDSKPQSKINELLKFLQQYANEIEYLGMSTLSITIWRFHPLVPPSDRCLRSCRSCIRAVVGLGGRGSDCQLEEFLLFPSNFSIGVGLKIQSETRFFLSVSPQFSHVFSLSFSSWILGNWFIICWNRVRMEWSFDCKTMNYLETIW